MRSKALVTLGAFAGLILLSSPAKPAETIRFGLSRIANCAPIAIAIAKGYFAAEGLEPKLTIFEAQAPIAVAVASGDLDFGDAAETAALYNLGEGRRVEIRPDQSFGWRSLFDFSDERVVALRETLADRFEKAAGPWRGPGPGFEA